jgi:ankyrin repeat protein
VNAKDAKGRTPLLAAIVTGNKDMTELLIAKGADVNVRGSDGTTPLHAAALLGDKDWVELLIEKGADINAKDSSGRTPLQAAAFSVNHKAIAELLSAKGGK